MANHKSAEKRARQNLKKKKQNKSYLSMVRSVIKNFQKSLTPDAQALAPVDLKKEAALAFVKAQSALCKAASKGIIHRNNVARKISRLASQLKKIS